MTLEFHVTYNDCSLKKKYESSISIIVRFIFILVFIGRVSIFNMQSLCNHDLRNTTRLLSGFQTTLGKLLTSQLFAEPR